MTTQRDKRSTQQRHIVWNTALFQAVSLDVFRHKMGWRKSKAELIYSGTADKQIALDTVGAIASELGVAPPGVFGWREFTFQGVIRTRLEWRVAELSRDFFPQGTPEIAMKNAMGERTKVYYAARFDPADPGRRDRVLASLRAMYPHETDRQLQARAVSRSVKPSPYGAIAKPQPFDEIWMGRGRYFWLDILARISVALEQPIEPIFVWKEEE